MIEKIEEIINRAEYFKNSYFWKPSGNVAVRQAYEKKYSAGEIKWTEEEKVIIYESDYENDIDELKEQIQELQEELNNI